MNARILRRAAVCLATLGLLAPPKFLLAAGPATPERGGLAAPAAQVADVALSPGGMLHGQIVDSSGAGVAGVLISVRQQNQVVAQATSDATGRFEVAGMPGGMFQLTTEHGQGSYRLWARQLRRRMPGRRRCWFTTPRWSAASRSWPNSSRIRS